MAVSSCKFLHLGGRGGSDAQGYPWVDSKFMESLGCMKTYHKPKAQKVWCDAQALISAQESAETGGSGVQGHPHLLASSRLTCPNRPEATVDNSQASVCACLCHYMTFLTINNSEVTEFHD